MEACEKLDTGRIIRLKMILEDGELTLSVKNPFAGTLKRKGNIFLTTKEESAGHGIGLLNVNEAVSYTHLDVYKRQAAGHSCRVTHSFEA